MRRTYQYALIGLVVIVVVVDAVVFTKVTHRQPKEDVFLESVTVVGTDPFTTAGSNQRGCDPAKLIEVLTTDPTRAATWVAALAFDPTVTPTPLQASGVAAYIGGLTATSLAADTRVTDSVFLNARAAGKQAVLQKGTAVLADNSGFPRVRCVSGSPLSPPGVVDHPRYKGQRWPGWEPPYCTPPGCTVPPTTTTITTPTTTTTTPATTPIPTVRRNPPATVRRRPPPTPATTRPAPTTTEEPTTVTKKPTTTSKPTTTTSKPTTTAADN